ncbi:hypothetical protein SRHO_G00077480 [Serrasalmus rhombeus]
MHYYMENNKYASISPTKQSRLRVRVSTTEGYRGTLRKADVFGLVEEPWIIEKPVAAGVGGGGYQVVTGCDLLASGPASGQRMEQMFRLA